MTTLLEINLENCFGIKKLNHSFSLDGCNSILIYAPNGIMKTSFAKTFDCIAKGKEAEIKDRIHSERVVKYEINIDGLKISPDKILVTNANDDSIDASEKISTFLASKELKKRYDEIYNILNVERIELIKELKSISQSADCEQELLATFEQEDIFNCLLLLKDKIQEAKNKFTFKYNDIFDKEGRVKKFIDNNIELIKDYSDNYSNLLTKSSFFYKSGNKVFGTYDAKILTNSISNNAFFDAEHSISLRGNKEKIFSYDDLNSLINNEINKIINDSSLKNKFEKIDKAITGNQGLRTFKYIIDNDPTLIPFLNDFEKFRKDVWLGYLNDLKKRIDSILKLFNSKKPELEQLIKNAKLESEIWKNIIDIFNDRFFVPFIVKLNNQEDIILKQTTANLKFEYFDENKYYPQDKKNLINILSQGERRAFNILQILFEIEARKVSDPESIIIFDDIADSFDYRNKHAIIEYIKDLNNTTNFKIFILTHNFDFYRNISVRLNLDRNKNIFMAIKNESEIIEFKKGQYLKNIFSHYTEHAYDEKIFISLIPFIRNLVEYIYGETSNEYQKLTQCLHIKSETSNLSTHDVQKIFKGKIDFIKTSIDFLTINFKDKNIKDFIYDTANKIQSESTIDPVLLENKIVLSIAIRLKTEEYIIKKIAYNLVIDPINSNQTIELIKRYKAKFPASTNMQLIEKVNMITPENIHLNSFMYEPLIDMSIDHLLKLYKSVSDFK